MRTNIVIQSLFTTKLTGLGTGLGLSLNYDFVKTQRGKIKVDSVEGTYIRFVISLPLEQPIS